MLLARLPALERCEVGLDVGPDAVAADLRARRTVGLQVGRDVQRELPDPGGCGGIEAVQLHKHALEHEGQRGHAGEQVVEVRARGSHAASVPHGVGAGNPAAMPLRIAPRRDVPTPPSPPCPPGRGWATSKVPRTGTRHGPHARG